MPYAFSYVSYRISKKKLLKKLKPFSSREFSGYINPIISENRGITLARAKQVKFLQSREVKLLLLKIGEPLDPYGKEIRFEKNRVTRHTLEIKVPYISRPTLARKLIAVIMKFRGIPFEEARHKKTVHGNELFAFLKEIGEDGIFFPDSNLGPIDLDWSNCE